jgi:hypothetical protein
MWRVSCRRGRVAGPAAARSAGAGARLHLAKMVLTLPTTVMLIDQLEVDKRLRQRCGWETFPPKAVTAFIASDMVVKGFSQGADSLLNRGTSWIAHLKK